MVWTGPTTPPSAIEYWGQRLVPSGVAMIPPPLDVRPELADDDIDWLNDQLSLVDRPDRRYARELPPPPPPPSGKSPPDTGWITMTHIRG